MDNLRIVLVFLAVSTQGYSYTNKTFRDCKTGIRRSWLRFENATTNEGIVLSAFRSDYEGECITQCYSEPKCNGVLFQDELMNCALMNFTFDSAPKLLQNDESSVLIHKDIACDNSTCPNECVSSPPLAYRCRSSCQICNAPDAYFDFESNNDVTLHGATFQTNSKNGRGISADGSSSWAELSPGGSPCWYAPGTCASQALTLGFWLRIPNPSGPHSYKGIISTLQGSFSSPNSEGFDVYLYLYNLIFKVREGNPGTSYTLESNIPSGWVYSTWVWRLSGNPKHLIYYENGEKVTDSNTDSSDTSYSAVPNKLVFGRIYTNRGGLYGNVEIDDLTIISEALSDTEVMELYSLHN